MAKKGQIVEQVLRLVNGGQINDDSKITPQEVGALLEQERDSLIRKTILENATLGEHELPSEFISVHRCKIFVDNLYGGGGRPFVYLPHQPVNLPNDGGIYRVCKVTDVYEGTSEVTGYDVRRDKYDILVNSADAEDHNVTTSTKYIINFQNFKSKGSYNLGNKFEFSLLFGYSQETVKQFKFQFNYKSQGQSEVKKLTLHNINTNQMIASLHSTSDFQQFLKDNKLTMTWDKSENPSENDGITSVTFESTYTDFYLGASQTVPSGWYFKSVLTDEKVLDLLALTDDSGLGAGVFKQSTYAESAETAGIYGGRGFGITINYSKNKRLKELGADIDRIKDKGSTTINTYIEITHEDMLANNSFDYGYGVITSANLAKMWINKYAAKLKIYGIRAYINPDNGAGAEISIEEETALGGFDSVDFQSDGTIDATTSRDSFGRQDLYESSERLNYRELYCYYRMANPGMYSKMYDNAILLSGRKYWYRQDSVTEPNRHHMIENISVDKSESGRSKLYLYNEHPRDVVANSEEEFKNSGNIKYPMFINVWMLAKSANYRMDEEFPVPADSVPDMIKSLVATFTTMRAAKEDVINDNVDIT